MINKGLPKIIKEEGFDFRWSNEKVWVLDLPVEEIDISELEWHFEMPFWNTLSGFYDLSPKEVMSNLDLYPEHKDRILNSDLSYPMDIMKNRKGKWLFLDGLHRLAKAKIEGKTRVKVRKVKPEHVHLILKKEK